MRLRLEPAKNWEVNEPSELAKVALVICLARFWASREGQGQRLRTLLGAGP